MVRIDQAENPEPDQSTINNYIETDYIENYFE